MTETKKRAIHIAVASVCAILFELLFLFCLRHFYERWSRTLYLTVLTGGTLLNCVLLGADLLFCLKGKSALARSAVTLYLLFDFFAVCLFLLVRTGFFEILNDAERFEDFLERSGRWMALLFVVLQFLQVVILPIPSTVTVVAGAALFGPFLGSLLSLLGIMLGSLVAFLIGRYAGHRVVEWLVGKETIDKWLKKIKGKDKLLLSAMFVLPVFPDDVLCFVAGISSMSLWFFLIVIFLSRVAAIFMTSYSITLIPLNTWWGLLIWGIILAGVVALLVVLYRKSDRILEWFCEKFHRETRVKAHVKKDEFKVEIVSPDGNLHEKGVKRREEGKDEVGRPQEKKP